MQKNQNNYIVNHTAFTHTKPIYELKTEKKNFLITNKLKDPALYT